MASLGSREKFSFLPLFDWMTRLRQQNDVLLCGAGWLRTGCSYLHPACEVSLTLSLTAPEMRFNSGGSHLEGRQ